MANRAHRKLGVFFLVGILGLVFGTRVQPARTKALQAENTDEVLLSNQYRVTFAPPVYHGDGTSTWYYTVEELPEAQDLSYWVLETPFCAPVVDAGPKPWEIVDPDPNSQLSGVKWETNDKFEQGEFWVTLETSGNVGLTKVAAKGPDLATGMISGPTCVEGELPEDDPPVESGDQVPPTLEWIAPVKEKEVFDLPAGGSVDLIVEAMDNVKVARVEILRWDAINEKFVPVTVDKNFPYQVKVHSVDLNPTWNQVFASSFDDNGNKSDWKWIWIYRITSGSLFEPPGTNLFIPLVIR